MSPWDDERRWLKDAHDVAITSAERARQKYEIVIHQQVDLWNCLEQEFITAVHSINSHGKDLLRFSQIPRSAGFVITVTRPGQTPSATVKFDSDAHCVRLTIANLSSGEKRNFLYRIQANDNNQAEFSTEEGKAIKREEIVGLVLDSLP
jgi:hypothetical protein